MKENHSFYPRQFPFNIWDFWAEQSKSCDQQSDSLTSTPKICLKTSTTSITISVYFREVYGLGSIELVPFKKKKKKGIIKGFLN